MTQRDFLKLEGTAPYKPQRVCQLNFLRMPTNVATGYLAEKRGGACILFSVCLSAQTYT